MNWKRPQKAWHWLLLFSPAIDLVFMPFVADRWGAFLFRHAELPDVALLMANLFVALALSIALGIWQAWHCPRWFDRILVGIHVGLAIALVNGTIAFAGCAIGNPFFKVL